MKRLPLTNQILLLVSPYLGHGTKQEVEVLLEAIDTRLENYGAAIRAWKTKRKEKNLRAAAMVRIQQKHMNGQSTRINRQYHRIKRAEELLLKARGCLDHDAYSVADQIDEYFETYKTRRLC